MRRHVKMRGTTTVKPANGEGPWFTELDEGSPLFLEAVRRARATAPSFIQAYTAKKYPEAAFLIKVPFDRMGPEGRCRVRSADDAGALGEAYMHLWMLVHDALDDLLFAHTFEFPEGLVGLDVGQTYVIGPDRIEDWMINEQGVVFGAFTLRLQRDALPEAERPRFDAHTGIVRFSDELP